MRKKTRLLHIGDVPIGGGSPIAIQSMLNTKTTDIAGSLAQLKELEAAGCHICRLAVPDKDAAECLPHIIAGTSLPLVADIHFDHRLALAAIDAGIAGVRINPGNIGSQAKVREVVCAAKDRGIPIRIGVNGGSLERDLLDKYGGLTGEAMVESAVKHIAILEAEGFYDIKVSLKASSVPLMIEANRCFAELYDYPLHLGVTEAGLPQQGIVKSAAAFAILLNEGIGDTIRVSLTADPIAEIAAAKEILNALQLDLKPYELISCPTCGRTQSELIGLAEAADRALSALQIDKPLKIAVMGCAVNGPGEAKEADFGIACGIKEGILFSKGELIGKYPQEQLIAALIDTIKAAGAAK